MLTTACAEVLCERSVVMIRASWSTVPTSDRQSIKARFKSFAIGTLRPDNPFDAAFVNAMSSAIEPSEFSTMLHVTCAISFARRPALTDSSTTSRLRIACRPLSGTDRECGNRTRRHDPRIGGADRKTVPSASAWRAGTTNLAIPAPAARRFLQSTRPDNLLSPRGQCRRKGLTGQPGSKRNASPSQSGASA